MLFANLFFMISFKYWAYNEIILCCWIPQYRIYCQLINPIESLTMTVGSELRTELHYGISYSQAWYESAFYLWGNYKVFWNLKQNNPHDHFSKKKSMTFKTVLWKDYP